MNGRRRWIAMGGVLVIACVAAWAFVRGMDAPMEPLAASPLDAIELATDATPTVSRIDGAGMDRATLPSSPRKPAELPPMDTPFNQAVEALEAAALAGDVVAACRLAAESWRCWSARQWAHFMTNEERQIEQMSQGNLDAGQLERRIDAWMAQKQATEQTLMACEGQDTSSVRLAYYDRLASESGDPFARMRYLSGIQLNPGATLRHPELLDDYRAHAFDYFTQALEAGDLEILDLWHNSTRLGDMAALTGVLPESWREPAFVEAVIAQLSDTQRGALAQHLRSTTLGASSSPEQQAEAAHLHARYFADVQPRKQRPVRKGGVMLAPTEDAQHCQDLPTH